MGEKVGDELRENLDFQVSARDGTHASQAQSLVYRRQDRRAGDEKKTRNRMNEVERCLFNSRPWRAETLLLDAQ